MYQINVVEKKNEVTEKVKTQVNYLKIVPKEQNVIVSKI